VWSKWNAMTVTPLTLTEYRRAAGVSTIMSLHDTQVRLRGVDGSEAASSDMVNSVHFLDTAGPPTTLA
jgi:hypothetical protein